MEATGYVQRRFYEDYPPHPKEAEYNYKCSSTMKPTQIQVGFFIHLEQQRRILLLSGGLFCFLLSGVSLLRLSFSRNGQGGTVFYG